MNALKTQLTNAFDPIYLLALSDLNVGYKKHSILEILEYLGDQFGAFTERDIMEFKKNATECMLNQWTWGGQLQGVVYYGSECQNEKRIH
jgi:hypothetical protein